MEDYYKAWTSLYSEIRSLGKLTNTIDSRKLLELMEEIERTVNDK